MPLTTAVRQILGQVDCGCGEHHEQPLALQYHMGRQLDELRYQMADSFNNSKAAVSIADDI